MPQQPKDQRVHLKLPPSRVEAPFAAIEGVRRLVLRPYQIHEAGLVVRAIAESLPELKRFMPWAHHPQTEEGQRERINRCLYDYWRGADFCFGIFADDDVSLLGGCGLHYRALNPRALEVGYWIHSRHAGKGLATAVTRCLVVLGFEWLGLERIQLGHDPANLPSGRVADKCGFKIEGRHPGFSTSGTAAMVADGWAESGSMIMRGLTPADIPGLDWYREAGRSLRVFDWRGEVVALEA